MGVHVFPLLRSDLDSGEVDNLLHALAFEWDDGGWKHPLYAATVIATARDRYDLIVAAEPVSAP